MSETANAIVTALYRRFKDWSKRGFGPDDVTWCEVRADVLALVSDHLAKVEAAREAALARVGELEKAIAPFARYAGYLVADREDDDPVVTHWSGPKEWRHITVGDFRRAFEALRPERPPAQDDGE